MRVDGMLNAVHMNKEGMNSAIAAELISRLQPGDVIRAQILDFITNDVLLKLFDSTTVKASVSEDYSGEVGKFANFVVKETLPDRLVLEEVKNARPESNINKEDIKLMDALTKLDIPKNEENIRLAKIITDNNLPLTKEVFGNTEKLINTYKDIDIPKAIIMQANKIDATSASIKQLGLLEKGSASLGNELNELISMLDDVMENKSETNQNTVGKSSELNGNNKTEPPKGGQAGAEKTDFSMDKDIINKSNSTEKDGTVSQKILDRAADTEKPEFNAKAFLKIIKQSLDHSDEQDLIQNKNEAIDKNSSEIEKSSVKSKDGDSTIKNDKKITSELKNEVEKLFVKMEDTQNEKNVDLEKNIKSLGEKLEKIKDEISASNLSNKEVLIQKTDNIINQLRFIDDIRSFGYYVPIPLKLNGTPGQADLYVLKRHKNKKINPEDAAIFLALDTINMGRVETLLLVNKKTISLNMRLQEQMYEDYVKSRFIDLYNVLAQKGYKLTDIKYRRINENTNIFNVNKVVKDIMSSNSGGLDIRL